ncbi:MAG: hypothetical protein II977_02110 [Oscillospiraceae bacterium]|nr:hypothetical protein [Oscillospiraceae bacterium]
MINKSKKHRAVSRKLIFSFILLIYISGLCCGAVFSLKNAGNLAFAGEISTGTENVISGKHGILKSYYIKYIFRDILYLISVYYLKNSRSAKGVVLAVPFILSLQNSCLYTAFVMKKLTVYKIISNLVVKDTAIAFIIIICTAAAVYDILYRKENRNKDLQNTGIYIAGIVMVYIIDYSVKSMFSV